VLVTGAFGCSGSNETIVKAPPVKFFTVGVYLAGSLLGNVLVCCVKCFAFCCMLFFGLLFGFVVLVVVLCCLVWFCNNHFVIVLLKVEATPTDSCDCKNCASTFTYTR
jgi:hypothetical protein